jgi:hypothetical protein
MYEKAPQSIAVGFPLALGGEAFCFEAKRLVFRLL